MIAPTNCNPHCDCAQRNVRCMRAPPLHYDKPPPMVIPASLAPPCGTPDQYGWSCCGSDPCKRKQATPKDDLLDLKKNPPLYPSPVKVTSFTFDDVERISESAENYDRIAAAIESNAEWFVDDSIDDADIAKGLRLAAKALRNGVTP